MDPDQIWGLQVLLRAINLQWNGVVRASAIGLPTAVPDSHLYAVQARWADPAVDAQAEADFRRGFPAELSCFNNYVHAIPIDGGSYDFRYHIAP